MNPGPAHVNYAEPILDALAADRDRPVLHTADGRQVTAGDVCDTARRLARYLVERGTGPGTTVGLLVGNTPEAVQARYAVALTGARVVVLHGGAPPATLARVLADAGCTLLLVDADRCATARTLPLIPDGPALLTLGPHPPGPPALATDALAACAGHPATPFAVRVHPGTDWCVVYTGGTTGTPKGVRMSHAVRLAALGRALRDPAGSPRYLLCTYFSYAVGTLIDLALLHGGSVVLRPGFEAGDVLRTIARERITQLWLSPALLWRLLDHPALAATDLSSLTRVAYGGCPAPAARLRRAVELLGPVLYGYYGQTEAGPISVLLPHEHVPSGPDGAFSVGRPLPGVDLALLDERGRPVAPGAPGEICVRSPTVMSGYANRPELDPEVWRDGLLRTGDLGRLDERGHLFVVDRLRDVLLVGGAELPLHVYPSELEDLLLTHPGVSQCAVFGVPGPDRTELIHAAAVPVPGHRLDLSEVRAFVTAHRGAPCAPVALHRLTALPLTAQGKPDKAHLRERYAPHGEPVRS
ncbi:AMP-binding protein [Streptomyces sp. NPDC005955]|uniref:AMP-binding protein n=1 Tax=Streptomyces sp. NPDC005955 TaxID=3364738 RepID=UPI00367445A3